MKPYKLFIDVLNREIAVNAESYKDAVMQIWRRELSSDEKALLGDWSAFAAAIRMESEQAEPIPAA